MTPIDKVLAEADESIHSAGAQGPGWWSDFTPRRWLSNGHLQTLAGNFLPRHLQLPEPEAQIVEVEAATPSRQASRVLCHCHWQPEDVRRQRTTALLLHGLEGSSNSQYVRGNAARMWAAGWNIVRMNMRNCGDTDHLSPTLYHSGLSADLLAVIESLSADRGAENLVAVGYSMGGNLVLKLAGDLGAHAHGILQAIVGVSPAMDLGASADAMHLPANRIYEWKFLRELLARYARKVVLYPETYSSGRTRGVHSLRQFDNEITAFYSGFASADDYYFRASSARVADRIEIPTLVMHALDDPFIRMLPETRAMLLDNRHVRLIETMHGGHCAFLEPALASDGYWAERVLLGFLCEATGQ
jgi:predicted alpha/beta-fold hydrolase